MSIHAKEKYFLDFVKGLVETVGVLIDLIFPRNQVNQEKIQVNLFRIDLNGERIHVSWDRIDVDFEWIDLILVPIDMNLGWIDMDWVEIDVNLLWIDMNIGRIDLILVPIDMNLGWIDVDWNEIHMNLGWNDVNDRLIEGKLLLDQVDFRCVDYAGGATAGCPYIVGWGWGGRAGTRERMRMG